MAGRISGPPTPIVYVAPPTSIVSPVRNGGFRKCFFPASATASAFAQVRSPAPGCFPLSAATIAVTPNCPLTSKSFLGQLVFFAALGGNGVSEAGAATLGAAVHAAIATTAVATRTVRIALSS